MSLLSFYLGRPFRVDTGEISVPKPRVDLSSSHTVWPVNSSSTTSLTRARPDLVKFVAQQLVYLTETTAPLAHLLWVCSKVVISLFRLIVNIDTVVRIYQVMFYRNSRKELRLSLRPGRKTWHLSCKFTLIKNRICLCRTF